MGSKECERKKKKICEQIYTRTHTHTEAYGLNKAERKKPSRIAQRSEVKEDKNEKKKRKNKMKKSRKKKAKRTSKRRIREETERKSEEKKKTTGDEERRST